MLQWAVAAGIACLILIPTSMRISAQRRKIREAQDFVARMRPQDVPPPLMLHGALPEEDEEPAPRLPPTDLAADLVQTDRMATADPAEAAFELKDAPGAEPTEVRRRRAFARQLRDAPVEAWLTAAQEAPEEDVYILLNEATHRFPESPQAHQALAQAAESRGDHVTAERAWRDAAALSAENVRLSGMLERSAESPGFDTSLLGTNSQPKSNSELPFTLTSDGQIRHSPLYNDAEVIDPIAVNYSKHNNGKDDEKKTYVSEAHFFWETIQTASGTEYFTQMSRSCFADLAAPSSVLLPQMDFEVPGCLVHTNFLDHNPEFGAQHVEHLYVEKKRTAPSVRLSYLPEGTILIVPSYEDFIPIWNGSVFSDQLRSDWTELEIETAVLSCTAYEVVPQEAVLIARYGIRTWGHWLGELLPKLVCVETAFPGRFKYVLSESFLTDPTLRSASESLEAYGIAKDRIIFTKSRHAYTFATLFVVSSVWSSDNVIHPKAAELMRLLPDPLTEEVIYPEKIAVLRKETESRGLANRSQIISYLEENEWTIIDLPSLPFLLQVEIFRRANCVVGILGSGLTGLLFSPENVNVLTLAPSAWGGSFFFGIMQNRNARLADIRGRSAATSPSDYSSASFHLDVEALELGLSALGIASKGASQSPVFVDTISLKNLTEHFAKSQALLKLTSENEPVFLTAQPGGGLLKVLAEGWSGIEDWGVWGVGQTNTLSLGPVGGFELQDHSNAPLEGTMRSQIVDVTVNGQPVATWTFTHDFNIAVRTVLLPDITEPITVGFHPQTNFQPSVQLPNNNDSRLLGMALSWICLTKSGQQPLQK